MKNPIRKELYVEANTRLPELYSMRFPLVKEVEFSKDSSPNYQTTQSLEYEYDRTEIKIQHVYKFVCVKS